MGQPSCNVSLACGLVLLASTEKRQEMPVRSPSKMSSRSNDGKKRQIEDGNDESSTTKSVAPLITDGFTVGESAMGSSSTKQLDISQALRAALSGNSFGRQLLGAMAEVEGKKKLEAAVQSAEPLMVGSKVSVECRGTVFGKTEKGDMLVVLDSSTHPGIIVVPQDTPLVPFGETVRSNRKWKEMEARVKTAIDVAEEVCGSGKHG